MNREVENIIQEATPEKWVNLEDIAEHLSVSTDTVTAFYSDHGGTPCRLTLYF